MKTTQLRKMVREQVRKVLKEQSNQLESKLESSANVSDLNVMHAKLRMLTTQWMSKGFQKQDVIQYLTTFVDNI